MRSVWLLFFFLFFSKLSFSQTATPMQGCVPLTVNFTAPAGGTTHFWDFGDGATATGQNPDNTFVNPGTYTVEYSATAGGSVIGTITINVYEQPVPEFTATPTEGCAPLQVNFEDATQVGAGVNVTGYSWVFGDGGSATGSSTSHWFTSPGSYSVSLQITTNLASCNATEIYNDAITVTQGPAVSFTTTPNPASSCDPPLTVSFNNLSSSSQTLTYDWDFGNGSTSTDEDPADQTYTQNGNYTITLTATDPDGCASTFTRPVTIGSPETDFVIPDTVCLGETIQMENNSSAGFYQWTFAAGNNPQISNQAEPSVTFDVEGLQDVTLTTSSGQCSSDLTIQIFVEEATAEFTSTPDYSCSIPMDVQFTPVNQGYATYEWVFGDSATSNLAAPLHTYNYEDTTEYSWYGLDTLHTVLVVTSSAGCKDTAWATDTLWLPNAVFFPDVAEGCLPLTVTFSDSSTSREDIVSWEWHLGDGSVINASNGDPVSVTYTEPGHFGSYLVIENASGCTDTSYTVVTIVGDELTPDFTVDQTEICPGDVVQFTNTTALSDSVDYWHYYSETNRQFHCFDDPDPTWTYENETGLQDVSLMVGWNGCFSTTTISDLIQVNGPIAEILLNCECDAPYDVDFANVSQDFTSISWDFGDGNSATDSLFTHTYAATGDYTVVLTAENSGTGCPTSYDTAVVRIRDIQAAFSSDSILCEGVPEPFDASASQDVFSDCWGGYTYQFDDPTLRPITTPNVNQPIGFPSSGSVGVTLIVRDINGCRDTASSNVRVYGIDADFSLSADHICTPTEVNFSDLSTSDTAITSWGWSFGDFSFGSDQNPDHTYTFYLDTINVDMVATNEAGCVDTASALITMYQPFSNVSSTPFTPNICVGQEVNFTATDYTLGGSNLEFEWDFMDGNTSMDQNPSNQFDEAGSYVVTLNYTEISSGCTGSATRTVNVQDYPIAGFDNDADTLSIYCAPEQAQFFDTTMADGFYTRFWTIDGTPFGQQNPESPQTNITGIGEYEVRLIVNTSYGCADTAYQTVLGVNAEGSFTIDQNTICRNESITFTLQDTSGVFDFFWDFGDGTSVANESPVEHTYTFVPPNGETVGKLVVSGPFGACPEQASEPIFIHEVVADFLRNDGVDTALCFQPFPLDNQSLNSDQFYWDFGFGQPSTIEEPGVLEFPQPGTYDITLGVVNSQLGCNDTIVKSIVLHPIPEVFSIGDTICEGDAGNLIVTNPESTSDYTWTPVVSDNAPVVDPSATSTTSSPLLTADYEIALVDTNGCTDLDTATISVINPLVLSNWDTTIVIGDSICLPIDAEAGLYFFEWTPTDGLDCDTCGSPCIQPMEKVTYSVAVTDILSCFTANADYTVDIYPETFISMPTTFTPNGDGPNDVVKVEGWGVKELIEFRIFNRWGEEIFLSTDMEIGWDGTYKGVLQNNDVYAYQIKALTWRDEEKTLEGYINLMR